MLRKLGDKPLPFDLEQRLKDHAGNVMVFQSEKQLLEALIARLYKVDPDVLVAHGLSGSVMEIILSRIKQLKVPHWSRIGRFKRQHVPHSRNEHGYSGGGWIPRLATAGRLLVDTFLNSKELVRETNYDLTYLADRQLKTQRQDFDDDMLPNFYLTTDKILKLVEHTEKDTFLTFKLMMHLNILPLTKQLTNIAGNLWYRSL
jgi:DNA polymerase alpha subunit A